MEPPCRGNPARRFLCAMNLNEALANIHRDRQWWRKVLLSGTAWLSVIGAPWAAGLVTESIENCRKGYPSPLPPTIDWSARYLIGLFALLIDVLYIIMPMIFGGCLFFAFALGATVQGRTPSVITALVPGLLGVYMLAIFLLGVSPIGRLLYVEQSRPDSALSLAPLQLALNRRVRAHYARARLQSLPAYLPFAVLVLPLLLELWGVLSLPLILTVVLVWLALCALSYAHLAVAQLYAAADVQARPFARR